MKAKAIDGHFLYYFADDKVSSDKIYTYVLYAYDDDNNYSYPIVVNVSLNDPLNDIICYPSDSITKAIKDE